MNERFLAAACDKALESTLTLAQSDDEIFRVLVMTLSVATARLAELRGHAVAANIAAGVARAILNKRANEQAD